MVYDALKCRIDTRDVLEIVYSLTTWPVLRNSSASTKVRESRISKVAEGARKKERKAMQHTQNLLPRMILRLLWLAVIRLCVMCSCQHTECEQGR